MSPFEVTLLVIATIASVAAAIGASSQDRRSSAARLAAIQRRLDLVMEHLGITPPELVEVTHHLDNERMIEAVRAYRKHTGVGLREAKQAVDRIAAGHRATGM